MKFHEDLHRLRDIDVVDSKLDPRVWHNFFGSFASPFLPVSRPLESSGAIQLWVCHDPEKWRASFRSRMRKPGSFGFFVIDCLSPGGAAESAFRISAKRSGNFFPLLG